MSMLNDIEWTRERNEENCISTSEQVKTYAKILAGSLDVPRPWRQKRSGMDIAITNLRENGIPSLHRWSNDSSHQLFLSASALSRKGKETTHFNAGAPNTELLFRIVHSVNQLSIYGAVSNGCEQFGLRPNEREPILKTYAAEENSVNKEILKSVHSREVNSLVCAPRTEPASGNRVRECLRNF